MPDVRASPGHSWVVFTVFLSMSTAIAESDEGSTTESANVLPLVVMRFHMICGMDSASFIMTAVKRHTIIIMFRSERLSTPLHATGIEWFLSATADTFRLNPVSGNYRSGNMLSGVEALLNLICWSARSAHVIGGECS
jgi:hypothetical protein